MCFDVGTNVWVRWPEYELAWLGIGSTHRHLEKFSLSVHVHVQLFWMVFAHKLYPFVFTGWHVIVLRYPCELYMQMHTCTHACIRSDQSLLPSHIYSQWKIAKLSGNHWDVTSWTHTTLMMLQVHLLSWIMAAPCLRRTFNPYLIGKIKIFPTPSYEKWVGDDLLWGACT